MKTDYRRHNNLWIIHDTKLGYFVRSGFEKKWSPHAITATLFSDPATLMRSVELNALLGSTYVLQLDDQTIPITSIRQIMVYHLRKRKRRNPDNLTLNNIAQRSRDAAIWPYATTAELQAVSKQIEQRLEHAKRIPVTSVMLHSVTVSSINTNPTLAVTEPPEIKRLDLEDHLNRNTAKAANVQAELFKPDCATSTVKAAAENPTRRNVSTELLDELQNHFRRY